MKNKKTLERSFGTFELSDIHGWEKHNYGSGSIEIKYLREKIEFKKKSVKQILEIFAKSNNLIYGKRQLLQGFPEKEPVRCSIDYVCYYRNKDNPRNFIYGCKIPFAVNLSFDEYFSMGCPEKLELKLEIRESRKFVSSAQSAPSHISNPLKT